MAGIYRDSAGREVYAIEQSVDNFTNSRAAYVDRQCLAVLDALRSGQSQAWSIMSDSTGVYDVNPRQFYRAAVQIAALLGSTYRVEFCQFDVAGQNNYGAPVILSAGTDGERYLQFDGTGSTRSAQITPTSIVEIPAPSAWASSTFYAAGSYATNDSGKLYRATTRGTSASSGGPTGLGTSIIDGSVIWTYVVVNIDRQWEFRIAPATVSGAIECIMAHQGGTGSRSWTIRKLANGDIVVSWHPDPASETAQSFTITAANLAIVADTPVDFKVVLDADNGSAGYTITAYKSTNNRANWTQIQTATVGGVTSVGVPTATVVPYEIGARGNTVEPFNGKIYRVQYREGIDGALMFPAMIEQWGTSTSGNAVLGGSPTLYVFNGAVAGKNMAFFMGVSGSYVGSPTAVSDGTDRFRKLLHPLTPGILTLNNSHNEGVYTNSEMITQLNTWLAAVRARAPSMIPSVTTQNPENAGSSSTSPQARQQHAARVQLIKNWALSNGFPVFDTFRKYFTNGVLQSALINADGIHPQEPGGYRAGSEGITDAWGALPATA